MSEDLDHLLQRLAARRLEPPLDGLDARVLNSLAQRREEARTTTALAPFRVASVGVAIAIGVTAGGMAAARTATEPRQFSTFSAKAHLAPSTLLEGGR